MDYPAGLICSNAEVLIKCQVPAPFSLQYFHIASLTTPAQFARFVIRSYRRNKGFPSGNIINLFKIVYFFCT